MSAKQIPPPRRFAHGAFLRPAHHETRCSKCRKNIKTGMPVVQRRGIVWCMECAKW